MRSKKDLPARRAVNAPHFTHAIFSAVELETLLDFTPEAFSAVLKPNEVAEALRQAGAPEPWENPPIAVGRIDNFVPDGISPAYREVRAAVSKLRQFLPDLIDEFDQQRHVMNDRERFPRLSGRRLTIFGPHNEHVDQFRRLKSVLDDILEEITPGKKGPTATWHRDAISLLNLYRRIVGPKSGISANGPTVTFIEIVFRSLTGKAPEKRAIEAAIRAWPYWEQSPAAKSFQ
jgi:hypothetical protein